MTFSSVQSSRVDMNTAILAIRIAQHSAAHVETTLNSLNQSKALTQDSRTYIQTLFRQNGSTIQENTKYKIYEKYKLYTDNKKIQR